jgi:DMSO/TMAO reductase YedYZ molybdopterin-dependent catalytic subunit
MKNSPLLRIDGEVDRPVWLSFDDLAAMESTYQVRDVSRIDRQRRGDAVKLAGLLRFVGCRPTAAYLGLHASTDDFHASIPLAPIVERGLIIYRLGDGTLPHSAGGPVRFYIPDFAACRTHEIDECANVKYVDHIELTVARGMDNRPGDDAEHQALHDKVPADGPTT